MKIIVVYYSLDGNTKIAAEQIAGELKADILRLDTVKKISAGVPGKFAVGGMQAVFGICPKLEAITIPVDQYDRIIIGTPVWAGKCAPAISSFLKYCRINGNLQEKVQDVFTCSGGGDNKNCIAGLAKKLPNLKNNLALADRNNQFASANEQKLKTFIEEIGNGQ